MNKMTKFQGYLEYQDKILGEKLLYITVYIS